MIQVDKQENVVRLEMSKDSTRYVAFVSRFEGEEDPYILAIPREEYFSLQTYDLTNVRYKLIERGFSTTDADNIQHLLRLYVDLDSGGHFHAQ